MACLIFKVSQTCYRYKARLDEENQQIAEWLIQLTNDHKTWGFKLCFLYLRNVVNGILKLTPFTLQMAK